MGVLQPTLGTGRPGQLWSVLTRAGRDHQCSGTPLGGCLQPGYSLWNRPKSDCIITTVLLNVPFFPLSSSPRGLWLICFALTSLGKGAQAKAVTTGRVQQRQMETQRLADPVLSK